MSLLQRVGRGATAALLVSVVLMVVSGGLSLLLVLLWFLRRVVRIPQAGDADLRCDYVLVPGKRLYQGAIDIDYRSRLHTAAKLWRNRAVPVYISGAACDGSGVSEAEAGAQLLRELGVDPQSIYLEEAAAHSYENIGFLRAQLSAFEHGAMVSNHYHLPRLCLIASDFGLSVTPVPAEETPRAGPSRWLRWLQEAFYIHWFLVARFWRGMLH